MEFDRSPAAPEPYGNLLRLAAAVAVVVAALLWAGPAILRKDIFDGDSAHHVFWLYRYADPSLFPDDITVRYLRTSAPLGYRALYAMIAPFTDVLQACETLSLVLIFATGALAWKTAASIPGERPAVRGMLGVLTFVVLLAFSSATDLLPAMAFQRTFAFPVTLLCLWGLVSRRYYLTGISWLLAALFYPVLLPVLGLAGGVVFLREMFRTRRMPDWWMVNGALGVASLALALFCIPQPGSLGPAYTYAEAVRMPEFGPHGRLQLFWEGSWIGNYLRFHMMGMGWPPQHLLAIGACIFAAWRFGRRDLIPLGAWALIGVGLTLWTVMRLFPEQLMFGLYLPNRHTRWSIAAFAIVAVPAGLFALLSAAKAKAANTDGAMFWATVSRRLAIAVPAIALFASIPHTVAVWRQPVNQDLENVYAFLETLPKQARIAAHPDIADYIPLRTRHSVVASTETSMPWFAGYYSIVKPRVEAELRAAYATEIGEVDREMQPYGADVFVAGPEIWNATRYLDPYNDMVQPLLARARQAGFALKAPPQDRVLFRSGEYVVVALTH